MIIHGHLFSISLIIVGLASVAINVSAVYMGHIAAERGYPFMVQILHKMKYLCGGAVIDRTHVMTSAQCVVKNSHENNYKIISETTRIEPRRHGIINNVKYVWRSKNYRKIGSLAYNDIAIFTVDRPFGRYVPALVIPAATQSLKPQILVTLTGWGAPDDTHPISNELKYLIIPMTDQDVCRNAVTQWWNLSPEHLCIDHVIHDTGHGGAARNDLGSILSFNGYLLGVVTLPTADIYLQRPDIYTKANLYYGFHEEVLRSEADMNEYVRRVSQACQSPQPSTSQQIHSTASCSNPSSSFVCASVRRYVSMHQQTGGSLTELVIIDNPPKESHNSEDQPTQNPNEPSRKEPVERTSPRQPIHDVGRQQICVTPLDIKPDPEGYYMVDPQSHSSVAQQNNIQPGDVEDLKCRRSSDDDDTFYKFLIYGSPSVSSQQCSNSPSEYVCELKKEEHDESENVAGTSQNINNPEPGTKRPSTPTNQDGVGAKRICITPEYVMPDILQGHHRINPQSYDSVAQQYNLRVVDIENLRCHNRANNDALANQFNFDETTLPPSPLSDNLPDFSKLLSSPDYRSFMGNEEGESS